MAPAMISYHHLPEDSKDYMAIMSCDWPKCPIVCTSEHDGTVMLNMISFAHIAHCEKQGWKRNHDVPIYTLRASGHDDLGNVTGWEEGPGVRHGDCCPTCQNKKLVKDDESDRI